jgi:hypothetical protein
MPIRFPKSRSGGIEKYATEDFLLEGNAQVLFTSSEVSKLFGRNERTWIHHYRRRGLLLDKEGQPLQPIKLSARRLMWTTDHIRDIAVCLYGRDIISLDEMKAAVRKALVAEDDLTHRFR